MSEPPSHPTASQTPRDTDDAEDAPPSRTGPQLRWAAVCLLLFVAGATSVLSPVLPFDSSESAPTSSLEVVPSDHLWVTWAISRGARAWLGPPNHWFESLTCYPTQDAVAHGEHLATLSLLASPLYVLSGNPTLTHNWAMLVLVGVGWLAMATLVRAWCRSDVAALVAATLYALGPAKITDLPHLYVYDTAWALLGLYFAWSALKTGRSRDVILAGIFSSLQLGTSLYPLVSSVFLAVPLACWLLPTYGISRVRLVPVAVALALILGTAVFLFTPYLDVRGGTELLDTDRKIFIQWPWIRGYYSWLTLALVAAGLAMPRRLGLPGVEGPLRWALVAGAVAAVSIASDLALPLPGGGSLRLYDLTAAVIPGLSAVRVPHAIGLDALHMVLPLLAGVGFAGLVRLVPLRARGAVAAAALALVFVDTLRPAVLGMTPPLEPKLIETRPRERVLKDFEGLARVDGGGPLLRVPFGLGAGGWMDQVSDMVLTEIHLRPSAACYNSYYSDATRRVERLAADLPEVQALRALRDEGFATLLVTRSKDPQDVFLLRRMNKATREHPDLIRRIFRGKTFVAFSLSDPESAAVP